MPPSAADGSDATSVPVMGVSIPVPPPYAEQLQRARAVYGDPRARSTPAHVTLLGPTAVPDEHRPAFERHLAAAAAGVEPFEVVLRGTGTFRPVSDVVFVQVALGIAGCEGLEKAIRAGRWKQRLAFPYHPHVTVAHDVPADELDRAFEELSGFAASFEVRGFLLYEQDGGGTWVPVREFPLGTT